MAETQTPSYRREWAALRPARIVRVRCHPPYQCTPPGWLPANFARVYEHHNGLEYLLPKQITSAMP